MIYRLATSMGYTLLTADLRVMRPWDGYVLKAKFRVACTMGRESVPAGHDRALY